MKKLILSISVIVFGTALSFGQKQESNLENKAELKKVPLETAKVKKVQKVEKHEKIKVQSVESKKVARKESTELKGNKED